MQRRAPSDEQEKPLSQNVTAKKQNKFSGVRKMPVENSARLRNRFAHYIQRKGKIQIWQGFNGVPKSPYIRDTMSTCLILALSLLQLHKLVSRLRLPEIVV
jgi:hypothetical protein